MPAPSLALWKKGKDHGHLIIPTRMPVPGEIRLLGAGVSLKEIKQSELLHINFVSVGFAR